MRGLRWIAGSVVVMAVAAGAGFQRAKKDKAADEPVTVYAEDLDGKVLVLSSLDEELGTLLTVRGEMVEADYLSRNKVPPKPEERIRVFEVGDRKLAQPTVIALTPKWFGRGNPPAPGSRFELIGYQTGKFAGLSRGKSDWLESTHRGIPASFGWHFAVEFVVLEFHELPAAP